MKTQVQSSPSTVFLFFSVILLLVSAASSATAQHIPASQATLQAEDGSVWEQVNIPGFGSDDNVSIVAMHGFGGRLYAMTRNEVDGVEVWRTAGTGWEQVLFPGGISNGIYGNRLINNLWGDMVVFNGKLYFGFSSGLKGTILKSTGCEIWRFDGTAWEPVISDKKDVDESGTITAVSDCAESDTALTAEITDTSKSWVPDQWHNAVLQVESGNGLIRKFRIIGNTADTLTIQQNECEGDFEGPEYTVCSEVSYSLGFPTPYGYTLGGIAEGDPYEIGTGTDESGFGDFWNKTITDMAIIEGRLYVSTGLNSEYGSQVWYTDDGDVWNVTVPENSLGLYHTDAAYPPPGKPVSSSITSMCASAVSGEEMIYAGSTGTFGDQGNSSRMAKLTPSGWELIVDSGIDANDTGTNESGFGDGSSTDPSFLVKLTGNFMPWSLADFNGKLIAGVMSLGGLRILYSTTGSAEDGSWTYAVGGDAAVPVGFDGEIHQEPELTSWGVYNNVALNFFAHQDVLYAGVLALYEPGVNATEEYLYGSHIWKSPDGIAWSPVTRDGMGDEQVVSFEGFTEFGGILYVAGSKGCTDTDCGLAGAKVFRLVHMPTLIRLARFSARPKNAAVSIAWATESEIDNAGFNIYRSTSENGEYIQTNEDLIPAEGSATEGAAYGFVDDGVQNRKTYWYKLEDIDLNGVSTMHGPVRATPRLIYGLTQ